MGTKKRKKQVILFGNLAQDATFFNHEASSNYEKVMEAYYFFHKDTMSKG